MPKYRAYFRKVQVANVVLSFCSDRYPPFHPKGQRHHSLHYNILLCNVFFIIHVYFYFCMQRRQQSNESNLRRIAIIFLIYFLHQQEWAKFPFYFRESYQPESFVDFSAVQLMTVMWKIYISPIQCFGQSQNNMFALIFIGSTISVTANIHFQIVRMIIVRVTANPNFYSILCWLWLILLYEWTPPSIWQKLFIYHKTFAWYIQRLCTVYPSIENVTDGSQFVTYSRSSSFFFVIKVNTTIDSSKSEKRHCGSKDRSPTMIIPQLSYIFVFGSVKQAAKGHGMLASFRYWNSSIYFCIVEYHINWSYRQRFFRMVQWTKEMRYMDRWSCIQCNTFVWTETKYFCIFWRKEN